ncbi:hypothetical protein DY000_02030455 [Brassica cretica]|uniref:Methyltransferase n=1 Tax=Brassica cretica TaxID=69181 RepID=A0ABQ7DKT1_BRACR|nr:hypothetical protein DY000_02030455 [Brassica cretica]
MSLYSDEYPDFEKARWYLTSMRKKKPHITALNYNSAMLSQLDFAETWRHRVDAYWDLLSPAIQSDTVRNIMDMKANMGSFATALNDKDVWVMNVVPEDGPNTLKLIYDRGLMGAVHSWCEAFSTYPRTYDLFLCYVLKFL